jgi:hypothetical protein
MSNWNTGDAMNAAIALWMYQDQKRQADKDPKFTPVPLTPEEQWRFDRSKENYNYSPMRDYVGQYSHQFLQGMNNMSSPNFTFTSPDLQKAGAQFAGGMTMPKFDFSQMPQYWKPGYTAPNRADAPGATTPTATTPPKPAQNFGGSGIGGPGAMGGASPMGEAQGQRRPSGVPDFGGWVGVGDGRQGAGISGAPVDGQGMGNMVQRLGDAWTQFRNSTPNWADIGISAIVAGVAGLAGLPASTVYQFMRRQLGPQGGAQGGAQGAPTPFNNVNGGTSEGYAGGPSAPLPTQPGSNYSGGEDFMGAPSTWRKP